MAPPPSDYFDDDFDPHYDHADRDRYDDRDYNDYEDWTREDLQGSLS